MRPASRLDSQIAAARERRAASGNRRDQAGPEFDVRGDGVVQLGRRDSPVHVPVCSRDGDVVSRD